MKIQSLNQAPDGVDVLLFVMKKAVAPSYFVAFLFSMFGLAQIASASLEPRSESPLPSRSGMQPLFHVHQIQHTT